MSRWHVHTLGDLEGCEISVIREDNEHGHLSYGWGEPDRKVIFARGGAKLWPLEQATWDRWHRMAQAMADGLNGLPE